MTRQVPRGPDNLKCPWHKKTMADVCHTCPMWTQVRGKNPQSEEEIDRWDCAVALLPLLLIENSQRQMQTAASVDKVANEMKKTDAQASASIAGLMTLLNHAIAATPRQLPNGGGAASLMIEQD